MTSRDYGHVTRIPADVACLYLRRGSVSNRGIEGPIYEILDEKLDSVMTFGLEEFKGLWAAQAPAPPTKV